jgi:hypothetical protein
LSSTSDCIIFLYLGMAVIGEQIWHTGNTFQKIKATLQSHLLQSDQLVGQDNTIYCI